MIVSTRNRPAFVAAAVRSVLAGDRVPDEVIVVDQSDRVNQELSAWSEPSRSELRYLWRPARGLSLGRNTGIAASRGELLMFLDDDVIVPPDWCGRLVQAQTSAGPRTVVTGRVVGGDAEAPGAFAPSLSLGEERLVHEGRPGRDVLLPLNMAMFRSAADAVGAFDERLGAGTRFPSSEDNDFGYRLLEAGYLILHAPDVVVTHRSWRGRSALLPLRWAYGRGQGAYFAKHASLRDGYMLRRLARDVARHLRRAPRRFVARPQDGLADVVYSVGVLAGSLQWLVARGRP